MELFEIELITCIKMDLALDNLQKLICHKTQSTKLNQTIIIGLEYLKLCNSVENQPMSTILRVIGN